VKPLDHSSIGLIGSTMVQFDFTYSHTCLILCFADEPAWSLLMINLLIIWQAGKTVVTTIHQPSSRLFHKFYKLILLGKGSLLYFGKASEAMNYFQSIGCSPLISMNPAEFLLDLANGNINDVSVPSELKDKFQIGNEAPEVVHEVTFPFCLYYNYALPTLRIEF